MSFSALEQKGLTDSRDAICSRHALTCAEYFAGIGLVRLGLEQAGWNILFANDWSQNKFEMYAAHFEDASIHYKIQDIFSICSNDIPYTLLATASFPCIDLSLAGNLEGIHGQCSGAFWGFTQILKHQTNRPRLLLLENVPGWLSANHGRDFRVAVQALNQLGYACDVFAIDAAHFVPQSRPRIFVVGYQTDSANQDISIFSRRSISLKTPALEKAITSNSDLAWNFLEVSPLPEEKMVQLTDIVEKIADGDSRWWPDEEIQRHAKMMSSINLNYLQELQDLSSDFYCTMYRRVRAGQQRAELRKDGIAGCLRTARGGSSRQILVQAGRGTVRMRWMTPREYARLQGVPDRYPIQVPTNQALTGFGDGVCVPVVTWIAEHILNPLVKSLQESSSVHHY